MANREFSNSLYFFCRWKQQYFIVLSFSADSRRLCWIDSPCILLAILHIWA